MRYLVLGSTLAPRIASTYSALGQTWEASDGECKDKVDEAEE